MKRLAIALSISACAPIPEEAPVLDVVAQAGGTYQGGTYQGGTYQGGTYQGGTYQGGTYQGSAFAGATVAGDSVSSAWISGTKLFTWGFNTATNEWEQRSPAQLCRWTSSWTFISCASYTLESSPSPLVGTEWQTTFSFPGGSTDVGRLRIDRVSVDRTAPFFASCDSSNCGETPNPTNADVFLYSASLYDDRGTVSTLDDRWVPYCPGENLATALRGRWAWHGAYTNNGSSFTLGCTNGTIAKCVRWGYKPWKYAKKKPLMTEVASLTDYHLSCTRAASADYCGKGHSYTVDGTYVDVFDNHFATRTLNMFPTSTAFAPEGGFNKDGGFCIAEARYQLMEQSTPISLVCPGKFYDSGPGGNPRCRWTAVSGTGEFAPHVMIDTSTFCSHTPLVSGDALEPTCGTGASTCPATVCGTAGFEYCCNGTSGPGWDAACVAAASSSCSTLPPHSECTEGDPLFRYASGCTAQVCAQRPSCCKFGWDASCVALAKSCGGFSCP